MASCAGKFFIVPVIELKRIQFHQFLPISNSSLRFARPFWFWYSLSKKTTQCQVGYKVTVRLWQSAWDCSGINTQGGTFTLACLWYLFLSNLKRKVMMIDESSVHTNNWFMYLSHWVFDFVVSINNKCKRHRRLICRVYATPPWSGFIIIWRVVSQMHWGSRIPVFFLLTHSVQGACVDTPLPPYPIRKAIV